MSFFSWSKVYPEGNHGFSFKPKDEMSLKKGTTRAFCQQISQWDKNHCRPSLSPSFCSNQKWWDYPLVHQDWLIKYFLHYIWLEELHCYPHHLTRMTWNGLLFSTERCDTCKHKMSVVDLCKLPQSESLLNNWIINKMRWIYRRKLAFNSLCKFFLIPCQSLKISYWEKKHSRVKF